MVDGAVIRRRCRPPRRPPTGTCDRRSGRPPVRATFGKLADRLVSVADGRQHRVTVQRSPGEVGNREQRSSRTDVHRRDRQTVAVQRKAAPLADRSRRRRRIGTLDDQTRVDQRMQLAVHRRRRQIRVVGEAVASHWVWAARRACEDHRRRCAADAQRRRHHTGGARCARAHGREHSSTGAARPIAATVGATRPTCAALSQWHRPKP